MRLRRPSVVSSVLALAALVEACGEECVVVPTQVALDIDPVFVEAPGEVSAVALVELGGASCGPDPTRVVAYEWRLDGEPLEAASGGPLGSRVVVELEDPGVHVLEVRVEDDLGTELPYVGRSSLLAY